MLKGTGVGLHRVTAQCKCQQERGGMVMEGHWGPHWAPAPPSSCVPTVAPQSRLDSSNPVHQHPTRLLCVTEAWPPSCTPFLGGTGKPHSHLRNIRVAKKEPQPPCYTAMAGIKLQYLREFWLRRRLGEQVASIPLGYWHSRTLHLDAGVLTHSHHSR